MRKNLIFNFLVSLRGAVRRRSNLFNTKVASLSLAMTQNTHKALWRSVLIILCLVISGCLDTQVPPFMGNDIITDDRMIGQWIPIEPNADAVPPVYTVIPWGNKLYQLHFKEEDKESSAEMTLFQLNGQTYLSVDYADSEEIDTLRYSWEGDILKLNGFNKKQFVALTQKEKLDFQYSIDTSSSSDIFIHLQATTEQLRALIEKHGSQLFTDKPMKFKRVNE